MERFVNKVAVVTGAAQGLGRAISKELLKRGLTVVGIDRDVHELQVNFTNMDAEVKYIPIAYTYLS